MDRTNFLHKTTHWIRRIHVKHAKLLVPLWLVVLAVCPYLPAVNGDFVRDDDAYVLQNPDVMLDRPWMDLFTESFPPRSPHGLYRPLASASLRVDRIIGDGSAGTFHVTNLVLHALATLLLFWWLSRMGLPRIAGFAGCALFAIHPTHAESVCWVSARPELLAFGFGMLALLCAGGKNHTWLRNTGTAVFLLAAMLSKESGAVFVALVPLASHALGVPRGRKAATWVVAGGALLAGCFLRWLVIGQITLDPGLQSYNLGFLDRLALGTRLLGFDYPFMIAWPGVLKADYPILYDGRGPWTWEVVIGAMTVSGCLWILAWSWKRKHPRATLAVLWFLVSLTPFLHVISSIGETAAQRFFFTPSAALALALASILANTAWHWPRRAIWILSLAAVLASITFMRAAEWRTQSDYWSAELSRNPTSPGALVWQGTLLSLENPGQQGQPLEKRLDQALEAWPLEPEILYRRAMAAITTHRDFQKAQAFTDRLEAINPHYIGLKTLQAGISIRSGHVDQGLSLLEEARTENRWDPVCREQLARYALKQADYNRVEVLAREMIQACVSKPHHATLEWGIQTLRQCVTHGAMDLDDFRSVVDDVLLWIPPGGTRDRILEMTRS